MPARLVFEAIVSATANTMVCDAITPPSLIFPFCPARLFKPWGTPLFGVPIGFLYPLDLWTCPCPRVLVIGLDANLAWVRADRPLQHINKKGRPVSQCQHCRAMRKSRSSHVKCDCGEKPSKCAHLQPTVEGHTGELFPRRIGRDAPGALSLTALCT